MKNIYKSISFVFILLALFLSKNVYAANFANPAIYPTGTLPWKVASGDFNADGKIDLATSYYSNNQLSIFLGVGDGTFGAATNYSTGTSPTVIDINDFNADGKLDLVVVNTGSNNVSVFLGVGDGTFNAKVNYTTGGSPKGVVTGDFNGDNKVDIAAISYANDAVDILLGVGNGTFGAKVSYSVDYSPFGINVGDFNADGKLDIVTANRDGGDISVLIGVGNGTFNTAVNYSGYSRPRGVVAGDFNGDSKVDIAVADYDGRIGIYIGVGDGTFSAVVLYNAGGNYSGPIKTVDFNKDGFLDLVAVDESVASHKILVMYGVGNGTFTLLEYNTEAVTTGITINDFNGDGYTDIVTSNSTTGNISVYLATQFPVVSGASVLGTPKVGQVLTSDYIFTDPNGDLQGTSTFRWFRDAVVIPGATSSTYTTVLADLGKTITFEVTPVALTGATPGTPVVSAGQTILNSAPVASSLSVTGTLQISQTLTGHYTFTDADSDPDTSTYRWLRDGSAIDLATSLTYTTVLADVGKTITFEVTPKSSSGTSPGTVVTSSGYVINNLPPTATHVTISGSPDLGQTLTGSYTYTDPDSDSEGTSIYKWYRNGTLTTEGSKYYFLTLPDTTNTITFEVTPIASTGTTDGISITSSGITINRRANSGGGGPGPSPVTLPVITHTLPTTSTSHFTFTKTLKLNSQNSEVKELQKLLNLLGFIISPSGAGSPGNETTFFGSKTKQALIKFQLANGLVGDGVMGEKTKRELNK